MAQGASARHDDGAGPGDGRPERQEAKERAMRGAVWVLLMLCSSCGAMRNRSAWGETATLVPSGADAWNALRGAALDPWTWAPLGAAALLAIDDTDHDLSDWAREHTPVFGSKAEAERISDDSRSVARYVWQTSVVLTPSGDELGPWLRNKLQGYVVEYGAVELTALATDVAKEAAERERPTETNTRSFWSGHTSASVAYCALSWRNFDSIDMPDAARIPVRAGLIGLAATAAWARVEAGAHYPADVLVATAAGNFIVRLVHDTFLGPAPEVQWTAYVDPDNGEYAVGISWMR
jgi:hypothetical protein